MEGTLATKQLYSNKQPCVSMIKHAINNAQPTLLTVSLTVGTGRRGRQVWKLNSIGFRPENNFTIP